MIDVALLLDTLILDAEAGAVNILILDDSVIPPPAGSMLVPGSGVVWTLHAKIFIVYKVFPLKPVTGIDAFITPMEVTGPYIFPPRLLA